MQLNEGVFSLNESGIQFLEKQKRTLKLSIPLTIILSLLITSGGIYRLGINMTSVLLLISANFLNYLLNFRYNNVRRKKILAQLVTNVTITSSSLAIELFSKEQFNTSIEAIITDDPRILFSEYTRLKERWNIKLDNEKEAWLIPGFFNEIQLTK
jgi:hypothetical protein